MGAPTIPAPHPDDITGARISIRCMVDQTSLDWEDPEVQKLVDLVVNVKAQSAAEIRWLRNILNQNTGVGSDES